MIWLGKYKHIRPCFVPPFLGGFVSFIQLRSPCHLLTGSEISGRMSQKNVHSRKANVQVRVAFFLPHRVHSVMRKNIYSFCMEPRK